LIQLHKYLQLAWEVLEVLQERMVQVAVAEVQVAVAVESQNHFSLNM